MLKVFKYALDATDVCVRMPPGAKPLHVATQGGDLFLWALVEHLPSAPLQDRRFMVVGTGFTVPQVADRYVGTAHLEAAGLVLHVFEVTGNQTESAGSAS